VFLRVTGNRTVTRIFMLRPVGNFRFTLAGTREWSPGDTLGHVEEWQLSDKGRGI
jgi:hypothetical protein